MITLEFKFYLKNGTILRAGPDTVIGVYNNPDIVKVEINHNDVTSFVILNKDERLIFYENEGVNFIGKQRTNIIGTMNRNKKVIVPLLNEVVNLGGKI